MTSGYSTVKRQEVFKNQTIKMIHHFVYLTATEYISSLCKGLPTNLTSAITVWFCPLEGISVPLRSTYPSCYSIFVPNWQYIPILLQLVNPKTWRNAEGKEKGGQLPPPPPTFESMLPDPPRRARPLLNLPPMFSTCSYPSAPGCNTVVSVICEKESKKHKANQLIVRLLILEGPPKKTSRLFLLGLPCFLFVCFLACVKDC